MVCPESISNRTDAGCNSQLAQYSNTPSAPGFEDSGSTELAEFLPDVAFCSLGLQFCPERSRENEASHEWNDSDLQPFRVEYAGFVDALVGMCSEIIPLRL